MFTENGINGSASVENILTAAGLDFEVEKRPLFSQTFERVGNELGAVYTASELSAGVFRTDTGAQIGNVTPTYEPMQNADVLAPFMEAVNAGYLVYKGGGAIDGGGRFSLTFEHGDGFDIGGDEHKRRIIVGGSHNGTWTTFIKTVVWRLICKNGLMGFGVKDSFKVRHTLNAKSNYDNVLRALEKTEKFYTDAMARYRGLYDIRLDYQRAADLTRQLLDIKPGGKVSTRKQNQMDDILYLTRNGRGIRGNSAILGTGAAWFNAVAEFVDHGGRRSTVNAEKRHVSAFHGAGEKRKKDAFKLVAALS
jgi:phage/plasmid-like protein (TIGR03299 family)